MDDARGRLAHRFDRRLVGEKIAPVDRIVEVLPRGVAFAFGVDGSVNPALGANGVGSFDRNEREQLNLYSGFGRLDRGHEPRQTAADDNDALFSHLYFNS
ncbi:hypothetical protein D1872_299020 [compost metagenome]